MDEIILWRRLSYASSKYCVSLILIYNINSSIWWGMLSIINIFVRYLIIEKLSIVRIISSILFNVWISWWWWILFNGKLPFWVNCWKLWFLLRLLKFLDYSFWKLQRGISIFRCKFIIRLSYCSFIK
jgi:hypothetical protein